MRLPAFSEQRYYFFELFYRGSYGHAQGGGKGIFIDAAAAALKLSDFCKIDSGIGIER